MTSELWLQYGRYLEAHLRIPAVVNAVYARAVRNCYWVGALWARAMRALGRLGAGGGGTGCTAATTAEQEGLYRRALQSGMQVGQGLQMLTIPATTFATLA